MNRLMEYTVFSGLVTAWRLATCPTSRSPVLVMATTDGVVRAPSWLGMTTGSPPCITATTELVVPRSIPIILLIATIPPEASCDFGFARISLKARRIQLGSRVPSPARVAVYILSVCLSSFIETYITYLLSARYSNSSVFFGCVPTLPSNSRRTEFTPIRDRRVASYGFAQAPPRTTLTVSSATNLPRGPVGLVRSTDELRLTTTATFPPFRGRILLLTRRGKSLKLFRRIV